MPAAVALMEPPGGRRLLILALVAAGAIVCAWDAYGLIFLPSRVYVEHHSIAYRNEMTGSLPVSLLFIVATCGALLLSTHRMVRLYGVANVIGLTVVELVRSYVFVSVWCFYAAAMSVIVYWQFSGGKLGAKAAPMPVLG